MTDTSARAAGLAGAGLALASAVLAVGALLGTDVGYRWQRWQLDGQDLEQRALAVALVVACAGVLLALAVSAAYAGRGAAGRGLAWVVLVFLALALPFTVPRMLGTWGRLPADAAYLGNRIPLLGWAAGLLVAGAVLAAVALPRRAGPVPGGRLRALLAGLAVGTAVAATAVAVTPADAVDATTAASAAPGPVPDLPSRQTWRRAGDEPVINLKPAGTGVVVLTGSGVTAVDGTTGTERWHYRRTDLPAGRAPLPDYGNRLWVFDEGRVVVADIGARLHGFDALTGELLWRDEGALPWDTGWQAAGPVLVTAGERAHTAVSARSGEQVWRWDVPAGCAARRGVGGADVVVAELTCGERVALVALDPATGTERWRRDGRIGTPATAPGAVLVDGSFVDSRTGRALGPVPEGFEPDSVDPASGQVLSFGRRASLYQVPEPVPRWSHERDTLSVLYPAVNVAWLPATLAAVDFGTCGDRAAAVALFDRATGAAAGRLPCLPAHREPPVLVAARGALVVLLEDGELAGFA
ncbi:PQQ-binding-like beta-propeller repeat protein [Amycolatopsis suaedae]|uniref:Pyrrolo-quinoline quinone repeat domain-containing protein n=1 Tax=Amycolatopsis suaedae TaxID=2510978 RepID=A0A4Q7J401_9PSEU|nr:PQQ-binding-like beta-propeller repeat protein [Amycolatopsis suaedae]RZQ61386.1 hypothetical protein EWH70_23665 [Amycolatopsis suaedae]